MGWSDVRHFDLALVRGDNGTLTCTLAGRDNGSSGEIRGIVEAVCTQTRTDPKAGFLTFEMVQ
jgi:hypothetical protein